MSNTTKAVFLSYASQDTEAAKRICDALRVAGVEVWFDQSELVGGDQWDGKIRGQISSCALFVPIISANTQARLEGYFRIEWKIAARRTHAMATAKAFLLPVVIDDTHDASAHVPDEFRDVQWTRLPGGETPAAFGARVKKLLSGSEMEAGRPRPAERGEGTPSPIRSGPSKWWWALPMFGVAMALALVMKESRKEPSPATPPPAPPVAETPATKTVARVTAMLSAIDVTRTELDLAADLLEQAVKSDPADAKLFATWAMLDCRYLTEYYDRSPTRFDAARRHAAQAGSLDGGNPLVRMARAFTMQQVNDNPATRAEAAALLESVRTELPGDPRVLQQLGWAVAWAENGQAAAEGWWGQQAKLPGQAAAAAFNRGLRGAWVGDFRAGYAAMAEADALGRSTKVKLWKSYLEVVWLGDLAAAKRTMAEVAVEAFVEDMPATARNFVAYWSRDFELALEASRAVPREFLHSIASMSPTGYIRGMALARLGRPAAAENEWRAALVATERRLATEPNDHSLLLAKGLLLVALGDKPAATQVRRMAIELHGESIGEWSEDNLAAEVLPPEEAISRLRDLVHRKTGGITAAVLRLNPYYDRFRENPRFVALQAEADADPRLSPTAKATSGPSPASGLLSPARPPEADAKSVAVLAFANLSDDKGNEYFSDGISEELLNVLAKVPKLKVAARTSSFHFKGKDTPIPEIARQLGVAYVVEGSVRKAGNRVRITAQLIKAADGFHVWSETYDRDLTDIFAVQDEIAKKILEVVKGSVLGEVELPHAVTTKIEAYTLFLQAQGTFAKRGEAGLREAIRLFEAALAIDPNYVPALVGLAQARAVLPNYAYLSGPKARETVDAALKAARRALELDPQNAAAFAVIGWAKFQFEWKWGESEAALLRARDLAPNDHWNWNCLGDYYRFVGDFPRSLAAKQREWELDPLSPNSHWDLSYSHLVAGNYDQAIHWADLCVKLAPNNVDSYMPGILAAGRAGRFDLMRRTLAAARQNVHEGEGMMLLLEAYAAILEKKPDEVRRILSTAMPLAEAGTASPAYIGFCLLLLGDADQAVSWLQRGYDRSDPAMVWNEIIDFEVIAANPKTRPILDQPGLKELYELRQRNARAGLNKL